MPRPQQYGRQGRTECQRVDGGNESGYGNGHGELQEKLSHQTGNKGAGDEHGCQNQSHGNDRPGHLLHGPHRGFLRSQTSLNILLHRLHHHNRIIHHNADRQHQPEQRQIVQAETEHSQRREGSDDGHGDRNQRNNGGTPALQKQQHNERHKDHGIPQ